MSTVDTLLNGELNSSSNKITISVNEPNRAMSHDGTVLLGVEGDHKAERIYFKAPRYIFMDELVDLYSDNIKIFIKFQNATYNTYRYECTDKPNVSGGTNTNVSVSDDGEGNVSITLTSAATASDDGSGNVTLETGGTTSDDTTGTVDDEYITFSWVLTEKVAEAAGKVKFIVCIQNIGTDDEGAEVIKNEWHSTTFEGEILKGIDVDSQTPEIINDRLTTAYRLTLTVNEAYLVVKNCEATVEELKTTVNDLESAVSSKPNKSDLEALETLITSNGTEITKIKENYYDKAAVEQYCDDAEDRLQAKIDDISRFKLIDRTVINLNQYLDISGRIQDHNELMIVIRMEANASTYFGLSTNKDASYQNIDMRFTGIVSYVMIMLNKTDYGYRAWHTSNDANNKFIWETDEYLDTNYLYLKNYSDEATAANMTIVIFGR